MLTSGVWSSWTRQFGFLTYCQKANCRFGQRILINGLDSREALLCNYRRMLSFLELRIQFSLSKAYHHRWMLKIWWATILVVISFRFGLPVAWPYGMLQRILYFCCCCFFSPYSYSWRSLHCVDHFISDCFFFSASHSSCVCLINIFDDPLSTYR